MKKITIDQFIEMIKIYKFNHPELKVNFSISLKPKKKLKKISSSLPRYFQRGGVSLK